MRGSQLTLFIILLMLVMAGIAAYYVFKQPKVTGQVATTQQGDVIGFEVTIVDKNGNEYTYNSYRPGIPTVLKLPDGTRVSQIIVKLFINPSFEGNASYLKVTGGTIRFYVAWGTYQGDLQNVDYSVSPVTINNPSPGVNNFIQQWTFTEADLENAAGSIADNTALDFRAEITTNLSIEIGFVDKAGNTVPSTRTGGAGASTTVSMTYYAGEFTGFTVSFG